MIQKQELRAALQPKTAGTEERTIDVLWYSGAAVERYDWWRDEEYLLQFDMKGARLDRLKAGAPFLKDHWPSVDNTIGRSTNAWIEGGKGYASFKLSATPDVDVIWEKIQNGTLSDVSMGVQIFELEIHEKKDKSEKKLVIAKDWEPHEVSVVAIGADPKAGFLSASSRDEYMAMLAARGLRPEEIREAAEEVLIDTGAAGGSESPRTPRLLARVRELQLASRIRKAMLRLA